MFGAEGADAVQAEAEYEAVFVPDADVEGVVLQSERAAIVGVADGVERADERRLSGGSAVFEIEKERRAAVYSVVAVADEDGRAPLRTSQGSGFFARRSSATWISRISGRRRAVLLQ